MFGCLNILDLATRCKICFPMPSKVPHDVLSVLEIIWINWAGPMSHLISDMGGEFEGELGEFMEAHVSDNISLHLILRGKINLLNATAESGKRPPEMQSKMSELEVSWKCEDASMVNRARMLESTRLDTRPPNGLSVEHSSCLGRFWTRSRAANWHRWSCQITRLSSVDECHGCGLLDVPSKPWTPVRCWLVFEQVLTHRYCERRAGLCLAECQEKPNRRADCTC